MSVAWATKSLGDACEVIAGQSPSGSAYNSDGKGLPFYQGKKEFEEKYIGPPTTWTTEVTKRAKANDILMSVRAPVGPINFATQEICIGRGLAAIRAKAGLDQNFLFYFLLSIQSQISGRDGAVFPSISRNEICSIILPIPPLPEQQRIAATLDEAFAGLATATTNAEKNLKNARELFEAAVVSDIFGDADERRWESATVAELALPEKGSIRTGPFGSQLLHGEFVDDGIAVLGIDNAVANEFRWGKKRFITPEKFAQLSRYQVRPGDVLITIMGTCGRCAIVPDDVPVAINTKHLCCISLDQTRCLPKFLHAYFLYHPIAREFLTEQAKGSIMDGLNMGIIQRLPVRLPPVLEQRRIIEKMDLLFQETRRLEANYQNMIKMIDNLKQSILQKAFSGELTSPPPQAIKEAAE